MNQTSIRSAEKFKSILKSFLMEKVDKVKLKSDWLELKSTYERLESRYKRFESIGIDVEKEAKANQLLKIKTKLLAIEQSLEFNDHIEDIKAMLLSYENKTSKRELIIDKFNDYDNLYLGAGKAYKHIRMKLKSLSAISKRKLLNSYVRQSDLGKFRVHQGVLEHPDLPDFQKSFDNFIYTTSAKKVLEFHNVEQRKFLPSELLELYFNYYVNKKIIKP